MKAKVASCISILCLILSGAYFWRLSWGAAIEFFDPFTSYVFGLPVLAILFGGAIFLGKYSEKEVRWGRFLKKGAQIAALCMASFYLAVFFEYPSFIARAPIRFVTKISKHLYGKTPSELDRGI